MPLEKSDEKFVKKVGALNKYFFVMALLIFVFIFLQITDELKIFIFIIGLMFFLIYYLTDKLLKITQILNIELTRVSASLRRIAANSKNIDQL